MKKRREVKFSDALIRRHHKMDTYELRDSAYPLRLRFTNSRDKASWYLVLNRNNKTVWRKVGEWPALTFKALDKSLPDLLANYAVSPDEHHSAELFDSVSKVLIWYRDRLNLLRNTSKSYKANARSVIDCHLLPVLGELPINTVADHVDDKLLVPLQAELELSTVRAVFTVLKAAFARAFALKKIKSNPLVGLMFSDSFPDGIKPRDGTLKSNMLSGVFDLLANEPVRTQVLISLLLAFATRLSETRKARWDQFDFNAACWVIPSANTKTKQLHSLPLSNQIIALLTAYKYYQQSYGYNGQFLFPGRKRKLAISASTASRIVNKFAEGRFGAHDCRKQARSTWADLNIDYMVAERLLNHAIGKLDATYIQTLLKEPKRAAIEQYHAWLDGHGWALFTSVCEPETIPRLFLLSNQLNASKHAA